MVVLSGCSDTYLWRPLFLSVCCHGSRFLISCFSTRRTCCCCHIDTWCRFVFCVSVKPFSTAAVFLCCIDFHCTLLVSPCCHSGVWCVALAVVLAAPVTAAALLLSRPPVGNAVFDVKHLDGSHSASGLSFTASHWPGQQPCQRNTAEGQKSFLYLLNSVYTVASILVLLHDSCF